MFKLIGRNFLIIISVILVSCNSSLASLQPYINASKGYQFLYPQGWVEVEVKNASPGVDLVWRDIIEETENLSVIISELPNHKKLTDLGSPTEVGYRFFKMTKNNPNLHRKIEFLKAESVIKGDNNYYLLEYQVTLENKQKRHNLASVVVKNGKLFTFNVSTTEKRWQKANQLLENVVKSFTV